MLTNNKMKTTDFPKKIKLRNRYNSNIYLEQKDGNKYVLKGDLEYMRWVFNDDKYEDICAVDPSGGPYISKGYKPNGNFVVENVYFGENKEEIIIELEKCQ